MPEASTTVVILDEAGISLSSSSEVAVVVAQDDESGLATALGADDE